MSYCETPKTFLATSMQEDVTVLADSNVFIIKVNLLGIKALR